MVASALVRHAVLAAILVAELMGRRFERMWRRLPTWLHSSRALRAVLEVIAAELDELEESLRAPRRPLTDEELIQAVVDEYGEKPLQELAEAYKAAMSRGEE